MRNDPLLIAVQILELFDLSTYTCESGSKPEFFVRINSEKTIMKVLEDRNYQSRTLAAIHLLHHNSVRYMKYFFEKLKTDQERWQFIEDDFMGRVEDNYAIGFEDVKSRSKNSDVYVRNSKRVLLDTDKKINQHTIYTMFLNKDSTSNKYYISEIEIEKLSKQGITQLSPDCLVAKNLIKSKAGDVFSVGKFEYMVEKIENEDI